VNQIITSPSAEIVESSGIPTLLSQIRPAWQAKRLITRVHQLITVDPSSACQRIFNASIHDLREKIIVAGLDIAKDAAIQFKLPPVNTSEDISEHYSTSKIIDLSYRMGILSRPDWRRLSRCYEIRRDLEHEDGEYEAGIEDCVYIFKTCIEVVLSRDPIHLIRVVDIKGLIEQPEPAVPAPSLLQDYKHAPQPRQEEILKFLTSIALDNNHSDLVRQNAYTFIIHFADITHNQVKLSIASHLQDIIGRSKPNITIIRVAYASGALPYLKQAVLKDFYSSLLKRMREVGYHWGAHSSHGELLRTLQEVGGLNYCPADVREEILLWMVLAYLGEPGGTTSYGNIRHVFYSNSAVPLIEEIVKDAKDRVRDDVVKLSESRNIRKAILSEHIQRRLDNLLDIIGD